MTEAEELELLELEAEEAAAYANQPASKNNLDIMEETSPEISTLDRLKLKAFGASDEKIMDYLRKNYPKLQVEKNKDRILTKSEGESFLRPLDPDQFKKDKGGKGFFSKETLLDIAEGAPDVVMSTLGQLGGEIAGAIPGAAAGGIIGNVPGAAAGGYAGKIAGGGYGSYLAEKGRQKIGEALGIEGNVDEKAAKLAGAIGAGTSAAFSSLIPGYTAAVKSGRGLIPKLATSEGRQVLKQIGKEAGESKDLARGAASGIKAMFDKSWAPLIAEGYTGIPSKVIKAFPKYADDIKKIDASDDFIGALNKAEDSITNSVNVPLKKIGGEISKISKELDSKATKEANEAARAIGEMQEKAAENLVETNKGIKEEILKLKNYKPKQVAEKYGISKKEAKKYLKKNIKNLEKMTKANLKAVKSIKAQDTPTFTSAASIDVGPIREPIDRYAEEIVSKYGGMENVPPSASKAISDLYSMLDESIGKDKKLTVLGALDSKQHMKKLIGYGMDKDVVPKYSIDAQQKGVWDKVIGMVDKQVDNLDPRFAPLRKDYAILSDGRRITDKVTSKDKLSAYKTLLNDEKQVGLIDNAAKVAAKYGRKDLKQNVEKLTVYSHLATPQSETFGKRAILNNPLSFVGIPAAGGATAAIGGASILGSGLTSAGLLGGYFAGKKMFGSKKAVKRYFDPKSSVPMKVFDKLMLTGGKPSSNLAIEDLLGE